MGSFYSHCKNHEHVEGHKTKVEMLAPWRPILSIVRTNEATFESQDVLTSGSFGSLVGYGCSAHLSPLFDHRRRLPSVPLTGCPIRGPALVRSVRKIRIRQMDLSGRLNVGGAAVEAEWPRNIEQIAEQYWFYRRFFGAWHLTFLHGCESL